MIRIVCLLFIYLGLGNENGLKAAYAPGDTSVARPNIIIIYTDDLGYGDLSCQGGDIPTPHIDRIGAAGIRFTDFYVAAPACTPSRYGLLTGAFPQRSHHGLERVIYAGHDGHLDSTEVILPQFLKQRGYATALMGKWHLGGHPLDHGFDQFVGLTQGCVDYFTHVAEFPFSKFPTEPDWFINREKRKETGYVTDLITQHTLQYLDQQTAAGQPFFLFLSYNAPHYGKSEGATAPPQLTVSLEEKAPSPHTFGPVFKSLQAPEAYLNRFRHIANIHRRYYAAMVANLDDNVGRVLTHLQQRGLYRNTIIWFISDNGGYARTLFGHASNGPLRGQKTELYEGGIRVPGLLCWPAHVRAGQVIRQPVINLDVLPTLATLTGFQADLTDRPLDGIDLSQLLTEGKAPQRTLFWKYNNNQKALRQGDWKWINDQLYRLSDDIGEKHNKAAEFPQQAQAMKQTWQQIDQSLSPYRRHSLKKP